MKVKLTTNQSVTGNTDTKVNFNSVDFDTDSIWDNTNKWAVIPRTGYYQLSSSIVFGTVANSGFKVIYMRRNNNENLILILHPYAALDQFLAISDICYLNAGDKIYVSAYIQISTTPLIGSAHICSLTIKEL